MVRQFVLNIHTENDAFRCAGNDGISSEAAEVAAILRTVADKLTTGEDDFSMFRTLFDCNGNDVGRAKFIVSDK